MQSSRILCSGGVASCICLSSKCLLGTHLIIIMISMISTTIMMMIRMMINSSHSYWMKVIMIKIFGQCKTLASPPEMKWKSGLLLQLHISTLNFHQDNQNINAHEPIFFWMPLKHPVCDCNDNVFFYASENQLCLNCNGVCPICASTILGRKDWSETMDPAH